MIKQLEIHTLSISLKKTITLFNHSSIYLNSKQSEPDGEDISKMFFKNWSNHENLMGHRRTRFLNSLSISYWAFWNIAILRERKMREKTFQFIISVKNIYTSRSKGIAEWFLTYLRKHKNLGKNWNFQKLSESFDYLD